MKIEKALFNFIETRGINSISKFLHETSSKKEVKLFIQNICFQYLQIMLSESINLLFDSAQYQSVSQINLFSRMTQFSLAREKDIETEIKPIKNKLVVAKNELAELEQNLRPPSKAAAIGLFKECPLTVKSIPIELNPKPISHIAIFNKPSAAERVKYVMFSLVLCIAASLFILAREYCFTKTLLDEAIKYMRKGLHRTSSPQQFFKFKPLQISKDDQLASATLITHSIEQDVNLHKRQVNNNSYG